MKEKTKRKFKLFIKVACGLLSLLLLVATILLFPLKGKSHIEVWAASDEFDINTIQSIEKDSSRPFKILQLSDTQLWTLVNDNNKCLSQIKELVEKTQPDLIVIEEKA